MSADFGYFGRREWEEQQGKVASCDPEGYSELINSASGGFVGRAHSITLWSNTNPRRSCHQGVITVISCVTATVCAAGTDTLRPSALPLGTPGDTRQPLTIRDGCRDLITPSLPNWAACPRITQISTTQSGWLHARRMLFPLTVKTVL